MWSVLVRESEDTNRVVGVHKCND
jgi:hypothetical protein